MKDLFRGYYRPTDEELTELWQKCVFIFDTNVLLNLYRLPTEVRDDFLKVLKTLSVRLWLPFQVALEYQENRLTTIADQVRKFYIIQSKLDSAQEQIDKEILQLRNRHSLIDPDILLKQIGTQFSVFTEELDSLREKQKDVIDEDDIRYEIDSLFAGKIGSPPESQDKLDEIYKQGKIRYEAKIPPGFSDQGKVRSDEERDKEQNAQSNKNEQGKNKSNVKPAYSYNGLIIKREYGDLIVWNQIIEAAKANKWQYIIFVTDDSTKDDWFLTIDSLGKKTIGPRPELVQEIFSKVNSDNHEFLGFYMYGMARFLETVKKQLNIEIEQKSVEEIEKVIETRKLDKLLDDRWQERNLYERLSRRSVRVWLNDLYPDQIEEVDSIDSAWDFMRLDAETKVGYQIYFHPLSFLPNIRKRIRDKLYRLFYEISKGEVSRGELIVMLKSVNNNDKVKPEDVLKEFPLDDIPDQISLVIGFLLEGFNNSYIFLPLDIFEPTVDTI